MSAQVKERPILFAGAMVRALLDGSKTQTRRVVKLPHANPLGQWEPATFGGEDGGRTASGTTIPAQGGIWHTRTGDSLTCPYGQPGDRLWVRETWAPHPDFTAASHYAVYRADPECEYDVDRWRPSIHMPRWASRILLEIVSVRVERLQDISVEEIEAEGVVTSDADIMQHGCRARVLDWIRLWESTGGSWDANPWVWVVEFKRVMP